jgi:hypothetical protein
MPARNRSPTITRPEGKAPWLLARFTQGAIAAVAVADVFRAVAIRDHRLHPTDASLRESGLASIIFVYLATLAIVLFLVWFSRCRRNAEILSPGTAAVSGVWAVIAWLIPVVNWWFPRQFLLNIERASGGTSEKGHSSVLVNTWWVVWVANSGVTSVGLLVGQGNTTPFLVVSDGLYIAAAVLAVCVIGRITALQGAALRTMSPVEPLTHA